MRPIRWLAALWIAATASALAMAQEAAKLGPEHDILKKLTGKWEATVQFGNQESKGTMSYHQILDGRWLESSFKGEFQGQKFEGKGLDGYDPMKKKFVSVWIDSMAPSPLVLEGTYDADKKTMTMEGTGPGQDGKPVKQKEVTTWQDDDTAVMKFYQGDDSNAMMTITYKRVK
jgi:hypothetical protein